MLRFSRTPPRPREFGFAYYTDTHLTPHLGAGAGFDGLLAALSRSKASLCFLVLIGFTVILESSLEWVEHALRDQEHYLAMLDKVRSTGRTGP